MEFLVFISYVFFAFLLFLFLNFVVKKFELTKIEYVLFSNIYLVVLAGIASCFQITIFCDHLFIILVFEFLIRMLYTTYLLEKDFFANEDVVISLYLGNIILGYLVNYFIIRQVDYVFLTAQELKFLLWVFIFAFLYHFFYKGEKISFSKAIAKKKLEVGEKNPYIISQYAKMKQKYGKDIQVKGDMRTLVYSIMIYENYKRPSFFRQIDYFRYQFDHVPRKQGIMQIDSKKIVSDVESISLVEKKLEKLQAKKKTKKAVVEVENLLKGLGKKKDEISQIEKIYQCIMDFSNL